MNKLICIDKYIASWQAERTACIAGIAIHTVLSYYLRFLIRQTPMVDFMRLHTEPEWLYARCSIWISSTHARP